MQRKLYYIFSFFIVSGLLVAQNQTIQFQTDTSGYLESQNNSGKTSNYNSRTSTTSGEVIPTVNGELNVNSLGALIYTVPIEVFNGVNNFQPNLALNYNSDGGNGQAGYGWNLVGLSVITQGGKSKRIDGVYQGSQFDSSDPYYLDGQRLIQVGSSIDYQTEHFSQIKIRRINTGGYTFRVQYPDGKVAKYKQVTNGQHSIALIEDAYGNQIQYNYTTSNNTPYINSIQYGKTTGVHPFTISFIRATKNQSVKAWRNGVSYKNNQIIKEIRVSSSQDGLYRKYVLTHDITSLGQERLRVVNVENGQGESLKPLEFNYNTSNGRIIEFGSSSNSGLPHDSEQIGGVTMGDFYGDGDISSVYWVSRGDDVPNKLINSKNGVINTNPTTYQPSLFTGKIVKSNGRLSQRDQLIEVSSEVLDENINELGLSFPKVKLTVKSKDLVTNETHEATTYIRGSYYSLYCSPYGPSCDPNVPEIIRQDKTKNHYVTDFNKDGLVDIIIVQNNMRGHHWSDDIANFTASPSRTLFFEVGKYLKEGGELSFQEFTGESIPDDGNIIEYDGDGIPEILSLDFESGQYRINVYKFNFYNNSITKPLTQSITNYTHDAPLIYGDYNGDGLTDFITPQKVFKMIPENSARGISAQEMVNDMESSQLIWYQYLNRGNGFSSSTRDFTNEKIAYIKPNSSYHHIKIRRSSFWDKLWSGTPDTASYASTDYGTSSVIPIDFNNDGKTDLAMFKKFGNIRFGGEKIKQSGYPSNVNPTSSSGTINHLVFHENIFDSTNEFSFLPHDGDEAIPIGHINISPYSFFINSRQINGLDSYQNKLVLYDPYTSKSHYFRINSDEFIEHRIQEIDNNSGIIQSIQYETLEDRSDALNASQLNNFYKYLPHSINGAPYHLFIHKQVPLKYLVAKVNTLFDGKTLTKEYRYQNALQHLDGLGFMGFQKTFISDIYESENNRPKDIYNTIFWTVNTYDPTKENRLVKTTYGGLGDTFFTESSMSYQRFEESNNRYLYLNTSEVFIDHLKDITVTKTHNYTSDLLLQSTTTQYDNVGTTIALFEYQPSWSSGEHFYHGRIKSTENLTTAYGDSFTTRDVYSNYNNAGIPLTHKKYGNGTDAITTTNVYDTYGNKTSETVSASGITSLTTTYGYDNTKRFIISVIDPEGLTATTSVNLYGWKEDETSTLGLTTTHIYDNWGNPLTSTNYLGITTTLEKEQLSNGHYSLSTTTPNIPQTIVIFDKFDRQIQAKTQSINNNWVIVETEYDIYGRKIKYSEPYFEGESATLWNVINYDELDRPVLQTMYNGKIVTTCYNGLSVTVEDDGRKHTKTLDAMGNTIYHKDSGGAINYSYYANGTLKEANYDGVSINVEQDGWGNKTKLDDPSAGIYEYSYDALGRKLSEITPKGTTTYIYDDFGKLLYENTVGDYTNISAQYEYDPTTKLPIRIIGNNGSDNFMYETFYDNYYRIEGKKETHPEFTYETYSTFDALGRADVITTQTAVSASGQIVNTAVKNVYGNTGIQTELKNNITGQTLWAINNVNAKGQTTQLNYGNGYQVNNTYNQYYLPENITHINNSNSQTALNIDYHFNNSKGLLLNRFNHTFNENESFQYDALYRLTEEILNGNIENQYTYDKRGRITHNTEIGKYEYASTNYQINKLKLNADGKQLKDNRGFANVTYNSYKKAVNIHLENHERVNFVYNLFKDRTAMYYGSEDENELARPLRKYYSSDKAVEIKQNTQTNTWDVFTYLDGDPYSASVVQKNTLNGSGGTGEELYYLHRDYQATILAISDDNGSLLEKRFFDAWGNLKAAWNVTNGNTNTLLFFDRGYTGHEHLQNVGLIHMNGRLYDAKLRRFLSPDSFVQDPYNTQNFDRYAYVLNNPLTYTDPDGELAFLAVVAIGAAVAITTNAIINISNGVPWWYGAGKSAAIGAVTAAISFGIGDIVSNWANTLGKTLFQAGAHGTTGGVMSAIEGGNFISGFAAGAVSSFISSGARGLGINNTNLKDVVTIASGGLSGGISSTIAGGNFWAGARQGVITSGLNHIAHRAASKWEFNSKFKEQLKKAYGKDVDSRAIISDNTLYELADRIPILKKMFEGFTKEVKMYAHDSDKSNLLRDAFVLADTSPDKTQILRNNLVVHPDSFTKVQIDFYRSAFASYKTLAITMYHEFVHVTHYNSGFIHNMYVKHGGDFNHLGLANNSTAFSTAIALSEVFAYWQTNNITGAPYINVSGYQSAAAHLKRQGVTF